MDDRIPVGMDIELSIFLIKLNQSLIRCKEILLPRILLGKINKF